MSPPITPGVEVAITGKVTHQNGTAASHYCIILTSGPCAVTTDANGNFNTKFLPNFDVLFIVKGPYNPATGDGPVVLSKTVHIGATGAAPSFTIP